MTCSKLKGALTALALLGVTCPGTCGLSASAGAQAEAAGDEGGRPVPSSASARTDGETPGARVVTDDKYDVRLPGPWGEELQGLRCRIAKLSRVARPGKKEAWLSVTIELQNHSDGPIEVPTVPKLGRSVSFLLEWSFFDKGKAQQWRRNLSDCTHNETFPPAMVTLTPGKSLVRTFTAPRVPGAHLVVKYNTLAGAVLTGPVALAGQGLRAVDGG